MTYIITYEGMYSVFLQIQISEIERPLQVPDEGLVCDLLWSDPDEVYIDTYITIMNL